MAVFNIGQQNVQGDVWQGETFNFYSAGTVPAALSELDKLLGAVNRAAQSGAMNPELAARVKTNISEAVEAAGEASPDKAKIAGFLNEARQMLQSVASLSGLASCLASAATMIGRLF